MPPGDGIMNIQILTHVRADNFLLDLWTYYYGKMFGINILHIMLDGDDSDTQSTTQALIFM